MGRFNVNAQKQLQVLKLVSSHISKQLVEVIMKSCGLGVRIFFGGARLMSLSDGSCLNFFPLTSSSNFWRSKLYKAVTFREHPKSLKQITKAIASIFFTDFYVSYRQSLFSSFTSCSSFSSFRLLGGRCNIDELLCSYSILI